MRRGSGAAVRRQGRRRWAWPVAVPAGLVLAGWALVGEVGSPRRLLRTLGDLGDPWADPVVPMISLLALLAETLVAYILAVLALRSLNLLPGSVGRVAGQVALLVTPVVVRRLLDLLVGGTLLAQATLVASSGTPPGHRASAPALATVTSAVSHGHAAPVTGHGLRPPAPGSAQARQVAMDPADMRPAPRRASAPLPPWLGGGPSNPPRWAAAAAGTGPTAEAAHGSGGKAPPGSGGGTDRGSAGGAATGYTVAVGDTLWDIAAAHLGPGGRTVPNVDRYWRQLYRANRGAIGPDADLIHPGTRLDVPPFRRDRR